MPLTLSPAQHGRLLVLAAAVLWGTTGTAQALAPLGAAPAVVGAVRLAIGGGGLLLLALAQGSLRRGGRWPLAATLLAAGSMAAYQLCFFAAVAMTGVAAGTVVAIGVAPLFAGILGFLFRGEQPDRRWFLATLLAVAGCALLILPGKALAVDRMGILLAVGAGAAYAVYAVAGKRLLENQPAAAATAVIFTLAALLLLPWLLTADLAWLRQPAGLGAALHLGVVATAVAYTLFARGLTLIPVATAVTLSLAEPLTAGLLGVIVLGERLSGAALVGVGLLMAGLAVLTVNRQQSTANS
jgi:drug/metabolite transporter, DME family